MSGVAGRAGADYERAVADYAADRGLPWERAPLRGPKDRLDLTGTLPAGFLVGCKAKRRGTEFGTKISEAMDQCDRALVNMGHPSQRDGNGRLFVASMGIVPVQVMQRTGYPLGKHYVVTQLDYFLDLAARQQKEMSGE